MDSKDATCLHDVALREAIEAYERGELILPEVLEYAEQYQPAQRRGSLVIATLPGDVHDIGRLLLVTLFRASGYTVHDLGSQVPIHEIVAAVRQLKPDALGLSALLVTTSRQMPLCIQALATQMLDVPVLVGGAAINRAFGRRSAILPDGRIYPSGVFYCRDVFEGLSTMDMLTDTDRRQVFIAQTRAEIEAERDHVSDAPAAARTPSLSSAHVRQVPVPSPVYWGTRHFSPDLREVWRMLDHNTLFRFHWGGFRASGERYRQFLKTLFEPKLQELSDHAIAGGWLQPEISSGIFACNADGDDLVLYAGADEVTRLQFPRQPGGKRLCLADYFRPANSGIRDIVALQAVTVGRQAGTYISELQQAGKYARMLFVNGLASATTEALAEYAHAVARRDLGLPADQGLRFSWGYAACPDLSEQRKVLALLDAERSIGVRLTESENLDPEHSTAALIVHHPEVTYFSVR